MTVETVPSSDALVVVYGARCQGCGHTFPDDNERIDPALLAQLDQEVGAEWDAYGLGEWNMAGWPRRYPAWIVRAGMRCLLCDATVLFALTPTPSGAGQ